MLVKILVIVVCGLLAYMWLVGRSATPLRGQSAPRARPDRGLVLMAAASFIFLMLGIVAVVLWLERHLDGAGWDALTASGFAALLLSALIALLALLRGLMRR